MPNRTGFRGTSSRTSSKLRDPRHISSHIFYFQILHIFAHLAQTASSFPPRCVLGPHTHRRRCAQSLEDAIIFWALSPLCCWIEQRSLVVQQRASSRSIKTAAAFCLPERPEAAGSGSKSEREKSTRDLKKGKGKG